MIRDTQIYKTLSLFYRYPEVLSFESRFLSLGSNSIILVGTPLHKNVGDHLIAEAELQFLHDCFASRNVFEIPTEVFVRYRDFIEKNVPENARIFITGGGWMGSLWKKDEEILQDMLKAFKDCPVVIFPQTIYYGKDKESKAILEKSKEAMSACKNLRLCTRDERSYKFACTNLPAKDIILAPDMALYLPQRPLSRSQYAGICLRSDREKVDSEIAAQINEMLSATHKTKNIDTMAHYLVPIYGRKRAIEKTLDEFSSCRIILTDRLHAMIFSVLSGTKCIAIDNKTKKVSGVYKAWLKWNSNIMLTGPKINEARLRKFIEEPSEVQDHASKLKSDFDELKRFVIQME